MLLRLHLKSVHAKLATQREISPSNQRKLLSRKCFEVRAPIGLTAMYATHWSFDVLAFWKPSYVF